MRKSRPTRSEVKNYEKNKKKLQELDDQLYDLKGQGKADSSEFKSLKSKRSEQFKRTHGYSEGEWL